MTKIFQMFVVLLDTLYQIMKKYLPLTRGEKRVMDNRMENLEEEIDKQEEKENAN